MNEKPNLRANLKVTEAQARQLALAELARHPQLRDWAFGFDRAKRRAGLCDYQKRRISISSYLLQHHELDEIHQVILHEIAHALSGKRAHHGPKWRATAAELGYRFERFSGSAIAEAESNWLGVCPAGHSHHRYRAPRRESSCGKCARSFDRAHLITWRARAAL